MNILLVNDDGYLSSNLELLRKELENYGDVYVFAPEVSLSGKSIALTIFSIFKINPLYYILKTIIVLLINRQIDYNIK